MEYCCIFLVLHKIITKIKCYRTQRSSIIWTNLEYTTILRFTRNMQHFFSGVLRDILTLAMLFVTLNLYFAKQYGHGIIAICCSCGFWAPKWKMRHLTCIIQMFVWSLEPPFTSTVDRRLFSPDKTTRLYHFLMMFQLNWSESEGYQRLSLSRVSNHNKVRLHNGNSVPYSFKTVSGFFYVLENCEQ